MKSILLTKASLAVACSLCALQARPAHPASDLLERDRSAMQQPWHRLNTGAASPTAPEHSRATDSSSGSRPGSVCPAWVRERPARTEPVGGTGLTEPLDPIAVQAADLRHDTARNVAGDYRITFSKIDREPFNLQVDCAFMLYGGGDSTIRMHFGGAFDLSVDELQVTVVPDAAWQYDADAKTLTFSLSGRQPHRVRMRYNYCNLTGALLYRECGCELWEPSFGEHFYPYRFGDRCMFDVRYVLPEGTVLVGGYPEQECSAGNGRGRRHRLSSPGSLAAHSLVFALLDTARYRQSLHVLDGDTLRLWLMHEPGVPAARLEELHRLTLEATAFFETCFGPYDDPASGIAGRPVYLFHGNGYANRNNLNLISASQEKFATKPHLLPLVHEIGHRWLGEWTLLIPDGAEGAYFIKESLNEYMTLLFVRATAGGEVFRRLLESDYREPVRALLGTPQDACLIDMRYNTNNMVVYAKGPLLLDRVASQMGYDRWIAFMRRFYATWRYRPGLTYDGFIDLLADEDPQAARQLDSLVRTN